MSWSDTLKGVVGKIVGQAEEGALPDLLKGVLGTEGLQAILTKLQDAGFGSQVSSWLDKNKSNLPITPEQIQAALGDEHVQQIAKTLGIPVDSILAALAKMLPELANAAGPAADPQKVPPAPAPSDPKAS
ncbi:YidB family protein [Hyphomicrobium sp. 99]|uniref:YidB family protein n=1 Tax=Hyphomicrobium sp. 99 TaxID=1163419 RepID=UPI0005F78A75|nr:YidB family protein [Hyphomicrobium sp. 99]